MSSILAHPLDIDGLDLHDTAVWERIFAHFRKRLGGRMASSTSTATPPKHAFEARVAGVKSPKSDVNALILDYLTMEGYPEAAANFSKEANLQPQQECWSIEARQQIKNCIHMGQIQNAIDALNDLDPEILDKNPPLHFALLRLQLVELIRACNGGDIQPALSFAQDKLGPQASLNPEFLEDLEKTMSLVIFPMDSLPPELEALLDPEHRREVANKTNRAILFHQSHREEATIRHLVKMRAWAENTARESKCKDIPDRLDLGFNGDDNEALTDDRTQGNGHEPMITT